MKTFLASSGLIATLVFAGLWLTERQRAATLHQELASLKTASAQQSERLESLQRTIDSLKVQRSALDWEVAGLQLQVRGLHGNTNLAALASPAPAAGNTNSAASGSQEGMGKMLSGMLKNPEMKRMIQQQQKAVMEMMYRPLFKELNLTPAESEEFMALVMDRTMRGMDRATALFGEDALAREEALQKAKTDHQDHEQKIKDFLGEERYAKYTDYNQTAGERMMLSQFTSANPITEDQTRQLLETMREEKRQVLAELGEPVAGSREMRDFQAMASEEEMNKHFQRQELVNSRIVERAKGILPQEQWDAFSKFQASQIEMQRMGLKMARTMFGGSTPAAGPK